MQRSRALLISLACLTALPSGAGEIRFTDRAGALPGPPQIYDGGWEHFVGGGVAVLDCDADGFPEMLAAGGANPSGFFRNVTAGPGAPIAFARADLPALDGVTGVTGAYPLDIDSDGALDLVVLRAGPNLFLKGDGACGFRAAGGDWGLEGEDRWSTAFSATWEPGRSLPTLAIGNYVDRGNPDGPFMACDRNTLFRPEGARYGPPLALEPGFCPLSMLFTDWSRRGAADLRISNDRQYYVRGGSEQMWRLDPLHLLGEVEGWRPVSIWGMGIASQDLNGDLRPDVMLTSMGDQLLQFATETAGYRDAPFELGATAHRPHVGDDGRPSTGWHAQFGDVDNDGLADLFIAKGNVDQMPGMAMRDPNNLLRQTPDGHFSEVSAEAGMATVERSRGAALVDLNRDGKLDLVVVNRRAALELWENATGDAGNWIAVTPRQDGANGFAIGAWVELRCADGRILTQELTVGGGHAGGQAAPLHFGLGDATTAEIRVLWPDGTASDWQTLPANRAVTLWRDGTALAGR